MLAFSFSGRLDTLDWVIYWADVVSMLLLPPLFVHFALVFPERPDAGRAATPAAPLLPLLYLPALLLGAARVAALLRAARRGRRAVERARARRARRADLSVVGASSPGSGS